MANFKYLEILDLFDKRFWRFFAVFLAKKTGEMRKCTHTTHIIREHSETPCPYEQVFSYFRPDRPKNLIFSIKLAGCGSNEGSTVFLG